MKKLLAIIGIIVMITLQACGSYEDCRTGATDDTTPATEQTVPA